MRISDWSSDVCSSDLRHRPDARIWRHFRRISTPYPDRFRSFDRIRRIELLSLLLLLRRWGARLMALSTDHTAEVPGFSVPVHRALTEHILLGGAPRAIAILNGTIAAAPIGIASCRERVGQYVSISVGAVAIQKTITKSK